MTRYLADGISGQSVVFEAHSIEEAEQYCYDFGLVYVGQLICQMDVDDYGALTDEMADHIFQLMDPLLNTAH